jgi:acetyl/propionyl-CoA carboxylase alpha subunit
LGKLIVYGQDRNHALSRLKFALEETVILGVGTNQNYLRSLIDHPKVREGRVDTGFLSSEFGSFAPILTDEDLDLMVAMKASGLGRQSNIFSTSDKNQDVPSPWTAFSKMGSGL